jgi:eukaryotic-like serine/threonine-protein kinase
MWFNDRSPAAGWERIAVAADKTAGGKREQRADRRITRKQGGLRVLDHLEGLDLDRVVQQQGPLPVPRAVGYMIQAACVLEFAHANGIIHRDIRPGTLMVDSDGNVRVLGLSLTQAPVANDPLRKAGTCRLTQTSTDITTTNYLAPEQAEISHQVDHRADIYSLGRTLFYLLTGSAPLPRETVQTRLMEHAGLALRAVRRDVPVAVEAAS